MAVVSELRRKYERELEQVLAGNNHFDIIEIWIDFIYWIDPALTDDERNAKTSHLSMLIHEEERKRESYRVSFVNFLLHSMKLFVLIGWKFTSKT